MVQDVGGIYRGASKIFLTQISLQSLKFQILHIISDVKLQGFSSEKGKLGILHSSIFISCFIVFLPHPLAPIGHLKVAYIYK